MRQILLLTSLFAFVLPVSSCRPGTRYGYTGRVYDGLTNQVLTDYTIELRWVDSKIRGHVDSDGVYAIEGVPSLTDYTIKITAADYRPFLSNNVAEAEGTVGSRIENVQINRYRDAYVFPNSARAPAATVNVYLEDTTDRPSGTVRLQASGASALLDQDGSVFPNQAAGAAGVARWANSLDTQSPNIIKDFTGGLIPIEEGELGLGIPYTVSFFNVPNYAYSPSTPTPAFTFTAGVDNNVVVTLKRQKSGSDVLHFVRTNVDDGNLVPTGDLAITFDSDIELDPAFSQQYYDNLVKTGWNIRTANYDGDAAVNAKNTDTNAILASVRVEGNRLVFRSTPSGASLLTSDPDDAIWGVIYNLTLGFPVRQKGRTDQPFVNLQLVPQVPGATTVRTLNNVAYTVPLLAQPPTP